jgi:hypothetical protein
MYASLSKPHLPPVLLQSLQSLAIQFNLNPFLSDSSIPPFTILSTVAITTSSLQFFDTKLAFLSSPYNATTELVSFSAEQPIVFLCSSLGSFVESHLKNSHTLVWLCAILNMLMGKVRFWVGERQPLLVFDLENTPLETLNEWF